MESQPLCRSQEDNEEYNAIYGNGCDDDSDSGSKCYEGLVLFEDAIASTGIGNFHYLLVCICGWALASDSVEIQVYCMIFKVDE